MLNIDKLDQFYGQAHTLRKISLNVPKGSCTVLMGRNGVGKTTLLKCIIGLLSSRNGAIQLDGNDVTQLATEQRAVAGIGYVPQGRQIFPQLTVEENLSVGLPARRDGSKQIPDSIYTLFPVLKDMCARRGGDLSGGQQQQLAIGRALVTEPDVLLLDEPTEGIQPNIVKEIGSIISRLNSETGLTVLLVEQKLAFAQRVGDAFALMDRGQIAASGAMIELNDDLIRRYLTV
ncbi:MAG: urea ABC transporter ATP-binding subunit UrtE [Granulosicoccus sp.]